MATAGADGASKKKRPAAKKPGAPTAEAPPAPEPKPEKPKPEKAAPAPPEPEKAEAPQPAAGKKAKAKAAPKAEPEPAPAKQEGQAKAKAKAEPKAKAEAKAKAEPKAEPQAEPKAEPKAKAKAKADAKAKAEPKAKAEDKAKAEPEAKQEGQAKAKAKAASKSEKAAAKPKAAPAKQAEEEEEEKVKKELDLVPGRVADVAELNAIDWEQVKPGTKKTQRRQERKEADKEEDLKGPFAGMPKNQKLIPGMASPEVLAKEAAKQQKPIPGQAPTAKEAKVAAAAAAAEKEAPKDTIAMSTASVRVPEKMIGAVIGPKGATLKALQERTGVSRIDTTGDTFTIMGPEKGVALAEIAIKELAEKGYTSLLIDNFAQAFITVHPLFFPDIIGKEGKVIRAIQDKLGVRVQIPETPKDAMKDKKKYKVTLAGSDANVQQAKQVLTDIITVYHSEVTHEGIVHEEMDIDDYNRRFIIGKGGCEIRHIQHNFKVRLYIPNDNSNNDKTVIVGERPNVDRAKTYIEKVLWNAENMPRGREANSGALDGDAWGEEEVHEGWMDAYVYKRK